MLHLMTNSISIYLKMPRVLYESKRVMKLGLFRLETEINFSALSNAIVVFFIY